MFIIIEKIKIGNFKCVWFLIIGILKIYVKKKYVLVNLDMWKIVWNIFWFYSKN